MESKGMKFAKQIMKNLGWTEGSGLGLNEDGITQPLKPTAKFDVSGLGHQNYNSFQWWDHAFNKAAKAFDIKVTEDDGVVVEKAKNIGKIKTKREAVVNADTLAYGKFCKTGTLSNGIMEASSAPLTIKEEKDYSLKLSDEELFKLCDGLTAHKGARHGLTASGKLARIAKQEALMLASLNSSTTTHKPVDDNVTVDTSEINVKKEKKKKRKAAESVDSIQSEPTDNREEQNTELIPKTDTSEEIRPKKKKKKSKKSTQELCDEESTTTENSQLIPTIDEYQPPDKTEKRKKKKKNKDKTDNESSVELVLAQEEDVTIVEEPKKKKKKNKHKHQDV